MIYKKENGWKKYSDERKRECFAFSENYKKFLDISKTEREFIENAIIEAEKEGFENAENKSKINIGDKIYFVNRNKNLVLCIIGKEKLEKGINYVVSHVDSPRIDIKPNPLYEDIEMALFKTHYYGGIKKYQWVTIPLALHGVVVTQDGKQIKINIGEAENDPIFCISDILPHLSKKIQDERKSRDILKGEELRIIVNSIPSKTEDKEIKDKVKYAVLEKLYDDYGMIEEDFISAELQIVPAGKSRDVGFDRALIGAYGQDDRVCGFTSLRAILEISKENKIPSKTAICYFVDKEEIGSSGSTGLESRYMDYFLSDIIKKLNDVYDENIKQRSLWNSCAISADVNAAMEGVFKGVHEEQNAAKLGYGLTVAKYTGHGGKYSSNDTDAEFVSELRKLLNENEIIWQVAELGKVDEGGGGTVSKFLAQLGLKTIDAGPALLSMHSPLEISSKLDIYESYRAFKAFFKMN